MAERATTKHDIQKDEMNTTRPNYAVVTQINVTGTASMASTGIDPGTGQVLLNITGSLPLTGGTVTGDVVLDGGVIINESGAIKIFRVEGDTDPNLICTDPSDNQVGIGKSSPAYKLDVNGDVNINITGSYRKNGTPIKYRDVYGGHGQGSNVPGSSTRYIIPFINGIQSTAYSIPLPAGTLKNLFVRQAGAQPGTSPTDDMVVEIYSGPVGALVATGIKVTFAGGSAAQDRMDTVNTYVHTDGNHVQVVLINSSASGSATVGGVTFNLESELV